MFVNRNIFNEIIEEVNKISETFDLPALILNFVVAASLLHTTCNLSRIVSIYDYLVDQMWFLCDQVSIKTKGIFRGA